MNNEQLKIDFLTAFTNQQVKTGDMITLEYGEGYMPGRITRKFIDANEECLKHEKALIGIPWSEIKNIIFECGKEYKRLNQLKELIYDTQFEYLKDKSEDIRQDQIKKIFHMETMINQLNLDISNVDLFEIIPNDNKIITCELKTITKTLHEKLDKKKSAISNVEKGNIKKAFTNYQKSIVSNLSKEVCIYTDGISQAEDNIIEYVRKIRELNEKIDMMQANKYEIDVNALLQDNELGYISANKDIIELYTLNDIILTEQNKNVGIDTRVNFGKYKIIIYLDTARIRIKKYLNNIMHSDFFHPHVNYDGSVCWGNLKEAIKEALRTKDIPKILDITLSLIYNYNPDNPYTSILNFARTSGQVQPNGQLVTQEDIQQNEASNNYDPDAGVTYVMCSSYSSCEEVYHYHECAGVCPNCGDTSGEYYTDMTCRECEEGYSLVDHDVCPNCGSGDCRPA